MSNKLPYGEQKNFSVFENTMVEMSWQEVQAGADRNAIILLPIGTIEAHGPHMDLSPDFYLSTLSCRFLKQELNEINIEALIAPTVYWGVSCDVAKYAGNFSVRPETMKALLTDILMSLKGWGFKYVFISNAHGDPLHIETIRKAADEACEAHDFTVRCLFDFDFDVETSLKLPQMRTDGYRPDYHAGSAETAQMNTFFPKKVKLDIAANLLPQDSFHPFAYCGDPASYGLEFNNAEFSSVDSKLDALKIKTILNGDKKSS